MQTYDAIVLGAGGVGSAAMFELARRGARVLGIDSCRPPHSFGSSHGHTRVIRQAYFEHPKYVPLLRESYRLWRELESQIGKQLFHQIGLVEIGPAEGIVVSGVFRAADEYGLAVEQLTGAEITNRWPGLRVTADLAGVYEPTAGYLLVEDCVAAHLAAAESAGAELRIDVALGGLAFGKRAWSAENDEVVVYLREGPVRAKRLIIAAGASAGSMLSDLPLQFKVLRKSLFWFKTDAPEYDVASGLPVFLFELPHGPRGRVSPRLGNGSLGETAPRGGIFYGFPKLDPRGVKVSEHTGGRVVTELTTADLEPDQDEQDRLIHFLSAHLPGVSKYVSGHTVCRYTMSPDEHFIIDRHPAHANVVFAAGLSGHGFKFTPVLGRALADLALDGSTQLPIEFLSLKRFS